MVIYIHFRGRSDTPAILEFLRGKGKKDLNKIVSSMTDKYEAPIGQWKEEFLENVINEFQFPRGGNKKKKQTKRIKMKLKKQRKRSRKKKK